MYTMIQLHVYCICNSVLNCDASWPGHLKFEYGIINVPREDIAHIDRVRCERVSKFIVRLVMEFLTREFQIRHVDFSHKMNILKEKFWILWIDIAAGTCNSKTLTFKAYFGYEKWFYCFCNLWLKFYSNFEFRDTALSQF